MLPVEFIDRVKKIWPVERFDEILESFFNPKDIAFRVNTLLATEADVLQKLSEAKIAVHKISELPLAYYVSSEDKQKLVDSAVFKQHLIYIQNPASQLPPVILAPQPNENVLDLTAAPGSKTTQIAALMHNQGRIAAVEKIRDRFFHLQRNLKENGASIVKTYLKDGCSVWRYCPSQFDRVLIDAPCSSESRFSILEPESYVYWSLRKVKEMQNKQMKLLASALQCVRPGGLIVYSTCSFSPEENESVVNKLLEKMPNFFSIESINFPVSNKQAGLVEWQGKNFNEALSNTMRILPNRLYDGFYLALLRRL